MISPPVLLPVHYGLRVLAASRATRVTTVAAEEQAEVDRAIPKAIDFRRQLRATLHHAALAQIAIDLTFSQFCDVVADLSTEELLARVHDLRETRR